MPTIDETYFNDIDGPAPEPKPTPQDEIEKTYFSDLDAKPTPSELQQSMFSAVRKDPDQYAKVIDLADRTQTQPVFADRNFDKLTKKWTVEKTDYDSIIKRSPGLAKWLQTPDNAAVGRDDMERLSAVDVNASTISNRQKRRKFGLSVPGELGDQFMIGANQFNIGAYHVAQAVGLISKEEAADAVEYFKARQTHLESLAPDYQKDFENVLDKESGDVAKAISTWASSFNDYAHLNIIEGAKKFYAGPFITAGETIDLVQKAARNPIPLSAFALKNVPYALPAIAGGAAGKATMGTVGLLSGTFLGEFATEFGSTMDERLADRGVNVADKTELIAAYRNPALMKEVVTDSLLKAGGTAGIDTAFLVAGGRLSKLGKDAPFLKKLIAGASDLFTENLSEGVSEFGGRLAMKRGKTTEADIKEGVIEAVAGIPQSLSQTVLGEGETTKNNYLTAEGLQEAFSSLDHQKGDPLPGPSVRSQFNSNPAIAMKDLSDQTVKSTQMLSDTKTLLALGENAKESKLTQRKLPSRMKELISIATDNDPDAAVYFQTDAFDEYWKSKGLSPVEQAEAMSKDGGKAYADAKEIGAPLAVPLSDFVSNVANTEFYNELLGIVRTQEDGPSTIEAMEFLKSVPATMEEISKEATEHDQAMVDYDTQAKNIGQNIKSQLLQAGHSEEVAAKESLLYERGYRTLAERQGISPDELFKQYPVSVGAGERVADAADQVLAQAGEVPSKVYEQADPFYHKMHRVIDEKVGPSATVQQVRAVIKELKPEEVKWSGIDEFLKGKEKVNKAELQEFLKANELQVEEVEKSDKKYHTITELPEGYDVVRDRHQPEGQQYAITPPGQTHGKPLYGRHATPDEAIAEAVNRLNSEASEGKADATKFSQWQVPGGTNYRELLLRMPDNKPQYTLTKQEALGRTGESIFGEDGVGPLSHDYIRDFYLDTAKFRVAGKTGVPDNFRSSHFDETNVLAHVRFNERTDIEGKRVLFIEEIQSDWHQQGRKKGYGKLDTSGWTVRQIGEPDMLGNRETHIIDENGDVLSVTMTKNPDKYLKEAKEHLIPGVPDAPFRKTWQEFALKRMIRYAAENGFDKIAWTTGEQQADRYALSKQIKEIQYKNRDNGIFEIQVVDKRGEEVRLPENFFKAEELDDVVGKDVAEKIRNGEGKQYRGHEHKTLEGLDLKVGGEGMKGFYDKIIPDAVNKLTKKFGTKVSETTFSKSNVALQEIYQDPITKKYRIRLEDGQIIGGYKTEAEAQKAYKEDVQGEFTTQSVELTDKLKDTAINEGFSLFQGGRKAPRGRITIGNTGLKIDLLKRANASTFLHETGHAFLEILRGLAGREGVSESIKKDWETTREFLGLEEGQALETKHHEKWARGFEAYLMEGKAPSSALKKAFHSFRNWLIRIYRQAKNLGVELSPDIRDVMDRLLASDREIAEAAVTQDLDETFGEGTPFQMTGKTLEDHVTYVEEARKFALEEFDAQMQVNNTRERKKFIKEKREQLRPEVTSLVDALPEQRQLAIMKTGTNPDGSPLPDGVEAFKLNRDSIPKEYRKEMPRGIIDKKLGMHVDVAANSFGYSNTTDFLNAMANVLPREMAIEKALDDAIFKLYGDPMFDEGLSDRALEALHNEHSAKILKNQLNWLQNNAVGAMNEVIRRVTRLPKTDIEIRAQAEELIAQQSTDMIKPNTYAVAERQNRAKAGEALTRGDLQAASDFKEKELLNHEAYRAAVEAKALIKKTVKDTKKFFKSDEKISKTRDMDYVNAGRAILADFGMGPKQAKTAEEYLAPIKSYAPDVYQSISDIVANATRNAANYREAPYGEFLEMKEATDTLWSLAKSSKEIEREGVMVNRDDLILNELNPVIVERAGPEKSGYTKAMSKWDKVKVTFLGFGSALRIPEFWADAMDKLDPKGVFKKTFTNPVIEAASKYREAKRIELKRFLDNTGPIKETFKRKEIFAPELNHMFKSVSELLHAVLHSGNDSNLSKLLRGRGWGQLNFDNVLDRSKWDAFISRMWKEGILTKEHYDWAQGVWDHMEDLKPALQKAHKKMYGYYFKEVTANKITTPWGEYRGGYVPAKVDSDIVEDARIKKDIESLSENNTFSFPTTGRGATRSRIEAYAAPLLLDLRSITSHIDWALRFAHLEPVIKDVAKIVNDKRFRSALGELDKTVATDMLIPWLQRSALQKVTMPTGTGDAWRGIDATARYLRKNTGYNIMIGNVTNAMQQITGLAISSVKVKPRYLVSALWNYVKSPKEFGETVAEKSLFLRTQTNSQMYEIQQTIDDLILDPTKYEKAKDFAEKHGYFLQAGMQNIVNLVTWSAAYDQAIEKGAGSDEQAVREADSIVRQTQGSFSPESIARFGTGSPVFRLFTMFSGYFNMQANLLFNEFSHTIREMGLRKGAGRMLYIYTMGFMIPAVLSELIVKSAGGLDEDDDGEYLDDILNSFFGGQFKAATAMFPFIGPAVNAGINRFNKKWYDDSIYVSPAVSQIESSVSAPHSVYKAITTGKGQKAAIKDTLTAIGVLGGVPLTGAAARPLGYLADVNEGKAKPKNAADFSRGLITGKK